jgi:signal transduction histidine kinase
MHPQVLDELGLFAAMKAHVFEFREKTGIRVSISIQLAKEPFPKEAQIHVYRIMQEALNNIEKHSQAKSAFVGVRKGGNNLLLTIEDDGVGIRDGSILDHKDHFKGLGFTSICERAYLLGGQAEIVSKNRAGLLISVKVPLKRRNKPPDRARTLSGLED